jgi:multiple sugar transport system ATP-binding protein
VLVGNTVVNNLEPRQRDVAMVFEDYALYPHMSAYQNIASPLHAAGIAASDIDKRVREVARMLKIEDLLERRPAYLSGGRQQRVSFGRALAKKASVYLVDEPLSHLDAQT